jgi:hypothetical protein
MQLCQQHNDEPLSAYIGEVVWTGNGQQAASEVVELVG